MPFGLIGAPATFQDFMNQIMSPLLRKCVVVFIDDVLVYSQTMDEHVKHLEQVFQILSNHQLHLKMTKCLFAQSQLEFLGHVVSAAGISIDPNNVTVIQNWPIPQNAKDVRSFLGMAGYYSDLFNILEL